MPFSLYTDASAVGLGAILAQEEIPEGVVAYASRTLQPSERNYAATELEALAVIWALEKFKCYFDGSAINVYTDHAALTHLLSSRNLTGRLMRWSLKLQEFPVSIHYRPGKTNEGPDALSRNPIVDNEEVRTNTPVQGNRETGAAGEKVCLVSEFFTKVNFIQKQKEDAELGPIRNFLLNEEIDLPLQAAVRGKAKHYAIQENILYRLVVRGKSTRKVPAIPSSLQKSMLQQCHDIPIAGHPGIRKTYLRVGHLGHWPGLRRDVVNYVKGCTTCQITKYSNLSPAGILVSSKVSRPWETIGIDLMGPYPLSKNRKRFLLVIVDYFTKWVELFPLPNSNAKTIVHVLTNEVFCRYGAPLKLVSDNGTQFISKVFHDMCCSLQLTHVFTAPYHPQSNLTERINRNLSRMIAAYVRDDHRTWDENLQAFAFALRTAESETTGETPAKLFLGRELKLPWNQILEDTSVSRNWSFGRQMKTQAALVNRVQARVKKAQKHQAKYYNAKRRDVRYELGDQVLLRTHPLSSAPDRIVGKFKPKWEGPYTVQQRLSPVSYRLGDPHSNHTFRSHVNDMKLYFCQPPLH